MAHTECQHQQNRVRCSVEDMRSLCPQRDSVREAEVLEVEVFMACLCPAIKSVLQFQRRLAAAAKSGGGGEFFPRRRRAGRVRA